MGVNLSMYDFQKMAQAALGSGRGQDTAIVLRDDNTGKTSVSTSQKADVMDRFFNRTVAVASKAENNRVREAFVNMVADRFNGRANIPASVLKALNFDISKLAVDEQGRLQVTRGNPLTARRILAVTKAIVEYESARENGVRPNPGLTAQYVREKTDQLFSETFASKTMAGARAMAEAHVFDMPDNEAFTETAVRNDNGRPQPYRQLSCAGRQLADEACNACRTELAGIKDPQTKATYLLEIETHLKAKMDELADHFIKIAYFNDAPTGAPGDACRAAGRMLAAMPELGETCCRRGALTAFGRRVVAWAAATCRDECRALPDPASRRAYMKNVKTHLREALNAVLAQYAKLFNDVQPHPLQDPENHVREIFAQPGFARFADFAVGLPKPGTSSALETTVLWRKGEDMAVAYRASNDFAEQLDALPENARATFRRACDAHLTALFRAAAKNETDPTAEGRMRVAVLAEGCRRAVELADRLAAESGIALSPEDRARIEDAFIREQVMHFVGSDLPKSKSGAANAEDVKAELTQKIAVKAEKIAGKRLAALREMTGLDAFPEAARADFRRGLLDGSIDPRLAQASIKMATAFKNDLPLPLPDDPTPREKLAALALKLTDAGLPFYLEAPRSLEEMGPDDELNLAKAALRLLSEAMPGIGEMVAECDPETVSMHNVAVSAKSDEYAEELEAARDLLALLEAGGALPKNETRTPDEIRAHFSEAERRMQHLTLHAVFSRVIAAEWGVNPENGDLPPGDRIAISFARQGEERLLAAPNRGEISGLQAAIEAQLADVPGNERFFAEEERVGEDVLGNGGGTYTTTVLNDAGRELVQKVMAQFRQEVDALPDPQDRALFLAAADERIAALLAQAANE